MTISTPEELPSVKPLDNQADVIVLIEKIMNDEFDTEEEPALALLQLEQSVPDPNVSDLIYYADDELSAEEIYEKAMSYKTIQL